MANRLATRVALITGGSGGIGGATARLFHDEGASVAIVDLHQEEADATAREIDPSGDRIVAFGADVADEQEAARVVQATVDRFGRLDILANVAGIRLYGPITEATPDSWQAILGVNLMGTVHCCKFAIPAMAASGGGSIINTSSGYGSVGRSGMAQYDATKGAVLALTRALACDHASDNIRVNTVSPGTTLTPYHVRRRMADTGESFEVAEAALRAAGAPKSLLGRQADSVEIANAILFLASDESSYITAINLPVDGGLTGAREGVADQAG